MGAANPQTTLVLCEGFRAMSQAAMRRVRDNGGRGPLSASRSVVLVPTVAAAHLFRSQLESVLLEHADTAVLPRVTTPGAFIDEWLRRTPGPYRLADPLLREAILEESFDSVSQEVEPPFRIRGGLARRVLQFYDELRHYGGALEDFAAYALEELDAPDDDGALKMAAQTRFLHASLGSYDRMLGANHLVDPPGARDLLRDEPLPYDHALVLGASTLTQLDITCLTRAHGLRTIRFFVTGKRQDLPERLREVTVETEVAREGGRKPTLLTPHPLVARDREESIVDAARMVRHSNVPEERIAIVVPSPLPYLYLAKKVLGEASIPYHLHDSFPLATEPYLAAVDLALELVETDGARDAALALLRNPFFQFDGTGPEEVALFDTMTLRYREPGSRKRWSSLLARKSRPESQPALPGMEGSDRATRTLAPLAAIVDALEALAPLNREGPLSDKVSCLRSFLERFAHAPAEARHQRAKAAVWSILSRLEAATILLGERRVDLPTFRDKLKRAFETHTFDERVGSGGVSVVDADSAGLGAFDLVILLGLNEGEWPSRGERNIFYPQWLLRRFGWPSDREMLATGRRTFENLLGLAHHSLALVRHQLEDEIPTVPSPFLEEVDRRFEAAEDADSGAPVIDERLRELVVTRSQALRLSLIEPALPIPVETRSAGHIGSWLAVPDPISPTSLELYLRCPFKYFSRYLLKLEEEEIVDEMMTPLERGRILHDVLEDGFRAWDEGRDTPRPIEPASYDEAIALFRGIAVSKIPPEHRAVELARWFGSPGEQGGLEWLFRWEMARGPLRKRLLEHGFQAPLQLSEGPFGERPWFVRVKGRIDRADMDASGALHVLDYKSGRPPEPALTLQVPLYAMCLSQELNAPIKDAFYLSFRDRRSISRDAFDDASARLVETVRTIGLGQFPPRPYQDALCRSCGFVGVCRKEVQESP